MVWTDELLDRFGKTWVDLIVDKIEHQTYPFAPGFKNQRGTISSAVINTTGTLASSVEYQVDNGSLLLYMANYWKYVNDGVPPSSKYPSEGYTSGGGTSAFISALQNWFQRKGIETDPRRSLGRAFATRINIWKFGVRPAPFYSDASEDLIPLLEEAFGEDGFEALQDLLTKRILQYNQGSDILEINDL